MPRFWRSATRPGCILVVVFLAVLLAFFLVGRLTPE